MVILPGITTSWTRNTRGEWLSRRELAAHGRAIHLKNVNSAGNYQLMNEESTQGNVYSAKLTDPDSEKLDQKCAKNP
jgi:hypothetical protein